MSAQEEQRRPEARGGDAGDRTTIKAILPPAAGSVAERKASAWLTELVGQPSITEPGRLPDIDPADVEAIRQSDAYRRGVERAQAEAKAAGA